MSLEAPESTNPQPGVYVFKSQGKPIYVGSTANLAKRPIKRDKAHHSRFAAILEATETELIPCESVTKAKQLEEQLIRTYHPKYNLRNPRASADLERTARIVWENW